jgi:hypothetical protein
MSKSGKKSAPKGEGDDKISDGMKIFGIVAGIVVGGFFGAIAAAVGTMGAEFFQYAGYVPTPMTGGVLGALIGGILGLIYPGKAGKLLGGLLGELL